MKEFAAIPSDLILDKDLGDKRIAAYLAIFFSGWNGGQINQLVQYSKFSVCRDRAGVLNQFKILIEKFISHNYLIRDRGIVYIDQSESSSIIQYSEFQRILLMREESVHSGTRINHAHILLLLAYIRFRMTHLPDVPGIYFDLLKNISENTGLSVRSITSGLKILKELNIIHNAELPRYQDKDGFWHANYRIFVNMEQDGKQLDWNYAANRGREYILARRKNQRGTFVH